MATKHPKIKPNKISPNVSLEIRKSSKPAPWKNVKVSNDQYAYLFTGGDSGHGDIYVSRRKNPGRHQAQVALTGMRRYRILACTFTGDINNQLGWDATNNKIGNLNTKAQAAKYSILVLDTGNRNCIIPCDPGVKNKP